MAWVPDGLGEEDFSCLGVDFSESCGAVCGCVAGKDVGMSGVVGVEDELVGFAAFDEGVHPDHCPVLSIEDLHAVGSWLDDFVVAVAVQVVDIHWAVRGDGEW